MRRWAAVAATLLLLTGCTAVNAPKPGLDPEDLASFRAYLLDSYWDSTGLSDDLRPPPAVVTTVTSEDWAFAYVKCMNNAGFDQYVANSDGSYTMGAAGMGERSDEEVIADFLCNTSFEIDGQFDAMYNDAQLDYLYSYYQQVLVPCLQLLGYEVEDAPSRAEFIDGWGGWHPYFFVQTALQDAFVRDQRVPTECPPTPAGVPDPGYAAFWSQQP